MKNIKLYLFLLLVILQLFVPVKLIMDRENVLKEGKVFKFKAVPIDPYDPFHGKYITLRFKEEEYPNSKTENWQINETVYVILTKDNSGFAKIQGLSRTEPSYTSDFVKAKIRFLTGDSLSKVDIAYPFNRFYMEESKAKEAEDTYRTSTRDTSQQTYALVTIKYGKAAITDVLINGESIKTLVEKKKNKF